MSAERIDLAELRREVQEAKALGWVSYSVTVRRLDALLAVVEAALDKCENASAQDGCLCTGCQLIRSLTPFKEPAND